MKDPAISKAERLRIIMSMPEYEATIGRWLLDLQKDFEHQLKNTKDQGDFRFAQGACHAMDQLKERFNFIFDAERAAVEKLDKKETRKNDRPSTINIRH